MSRSRSEVFRFYLRFRFRSRHGTVIVPVPWLTLSLHSPFPTKGTLDHTCPQCIKLIGGYRPHLWQSGKLCHGGKVWGSLPKNYKPSPQWRKPSNVSICSSHGRRVLRKVDCQLQSQIRRHVPKDSFLIYNCVPRKLKRHSSQNQMPIFAIFSTL